MSFDVTAPVRTATVMKVMRIYDDDVVVGKRNYTHTLSSSDF